MPASAAQVVVLFAEPRSHVHDAGALVDGDEVACKDAKSVRLVSEEIEKRAVRPLDETVARHLRHRLALADQLLVRPLTGLCENHEVPVYVIHGVNDVVSDRERQVRRKRPGCRRPHEQVERPVDRVLVALFAPRTVELIERVELERDRHHLVLTRAVRVVLSGLEVRKRGLALPAVREDPFPLVDEAVLVETLERPHDAFHVRQVHGAVRACEIDPARLAGHVPFP